MDLERLGPYRIVRPLGTGGMASAYLAKHETLLKEVVLKVIAPTLASVESYRKRFLHEAQALARLSHPNIVQVYDASVDDRTCYMAMEYVEGRDLQSYLSGTERVDLPWLLGILRDVSLGLQCVHDAGLVHRDIKPANILITDSGRAKITDFGISVETEDTLRLTSSGSIIGTPNYISPEQALGKPIDGRADLYSLGVVLYQAVSGKPIFKAETAAALLMKHAHETPTPLGIAAPGTPAVVQEIAKKLLAKRPQARYASAGALAQALDEAIASIAGRKKPERHRPPTRTRRAAAGAPLSSRPSPNRVWAFVGGGAVALALLVIVAVKLGGPSRAPERTVETTRPEPPPKPPPETGDRKPEPEVPKPKETDPAEALRLQLDNIIGVINLAGLSAAYCDLRGMEDRASELRSTMRKAQAEAESLAASLGDSDARRHADRRMRPEDRLISFSGRNLDDMRKEAAAALLGTFVAKVVSGSETRVTLLRDGRVEELSIRFAQAAPEFGAVIEAAGLVPGQTVTVPEPGTEANRPPARKETSPRPEEPAKAAPPDEAAQKKAEKEIREIFREDYAKNTPAGKAALAKKLLDEAGGSRSDPVAHFVLLREARDLAAQAADVRMAYAAIEEMSILYRIDLFGMKNEALSAAAKNATGTEELRRLAAAGLELAADAAAAGEYETASKAAASAAGFARRGKDVPLTVKANARAKEIAELQNRHEKVKKARETLAANPDDPAANLAVGQYLCLVQSDWDAGLPHLKKGSDETLKALAAKDLAGTVDPLEQVGVGDGWWDLAEKLAEAEKANVRKRAEFWYEKALPRLSGLQRTRIEKRLGQEAAGRLERGEGWVDITDPRMFGLGGRAGDPVSVRGGRTGTLVILQALPPGDFDGFSLRMRLEPGVEPLGSVVFEERNRLLYVSGLNLIGVCHSEQGRLAHDFGPHNCGKLESHVITLMIRDGRYILSLGGIELGRFNAGPDRITYLALQATSGLVTFDQIRLHRK